MYIVHVCTPIMWTELHKLQACTFSYIILKLCYKTQKGSAQCQQEAASIESIDPICTVTAVIIMPTAKLLYYQDKLTLARYDYCNLALFGNDTSPVLLLK